VTATNKKEGGIGGIKGGGRVGSGRAGGEGGLTSKFGKKQPGKEGGEPVSEKANTDKVAFKDLEKMEEHKALVERFNHDFSVVTQTGASVKPPEPEKEENKEGGGKEIIKEGSKKIPGGGKSIPPGAEKGKKFRPETPGGTKGGGPDAEDTT